MQWGFTKPASERIRKPATGNGKIASLTVVLTDGTILAVAKDGTSYSASLTRPSNHAGIDPYRESLVLPGIGSTISRILNPLHLESCTRATLFTMLTLSSWIEELQVSK